MPCLQFQILHVGVIIYPNWSKPERDVKIHPLILEGLVSEHVRTKTQSQTYVNGGLVPTRTKYTVSFRTIRHIATVSLYFDGENTFTGLK